MASSSGGPLEFTTNTNQQYGVKDSEFYMVDLNDGFIARVVVDISPSDPTYRDVNNVPNPANMYRVQVIEMASGLITSSFTSVVVPLVFDGKALVVKTGSDTSLLYLATYSYQGAGVWAFSEVAIAETVDLGFRYPSVRFQHTTPTKFVLNNFNYGTIIEIPDVNDLSTITYSPSPLQGNAFNEFTETGMVSVNQYDSYSNVTVHYYDADTYTARGNFGINKQNIRSSTSYKDNAYYYFILATLNNYSGYAYKDNFEVYVNDFPIDASNGTNNTGASGWSSQAGSGLSVITYNEDSPQTQRTFTGVGPFARKGLVFSAGICYQSAEGNNCPGVVVFDRNNGADTVTVHTISIPDAANNHYFPAQTFVDSSGTVFARFETDTSNSTILMLKNGVVTNLNLNVNYVLPVGTSTFYTFNQDPPVVI
jgi:hypothetical protein